MQDAEDRRRTFLSAAAILLVGFAVWAGSFQGAFAFDDHSNISSNKAVHRLWPPWPILTGPRPTVDMTFAVNYALHGVRPWGYHLVNLAVHLGAALLLFGVARRTLATVLIVRGQAGGDESAADSPTKRTAALLALIITLLWTVHPLQTQAVTYIVQRGESLMGFFYLLTLYAAIRSFSSPRAAAWRALAMGACALGMGAKPVMFSAPLIVLLYDTLFAAGSPLRAVRRAPGFYLVLAATWLILAAPFVMHPSADPSAGFGMLNLTPWQYACTQAGVILHYLRLAFWPSPLCFDYYWPVTPFREAVLPGIVVLVLLGVTTWALVRRRPVGFLGAWFFLILAPSSSIVPIADTCFEHRMYLSLAAVIALTVLAAFALVRQMGRLSPAAGRAARDLTLILAIVCVAALGFLTTVRNIYYADPVTLWGNVTQQRPYNPRAYFNLGYELFQREKFDEAAAAFERSVALLPGRHDTQKNYALALARLGRYAEALPHFAEGLRLQSADADAQCNYANALMATGRTGEALEHYRESVRLKPESSDTQANYGRALLSVGRPDEAAQHFREAIRLSPESVAARNDLGTALAAQGEFAEAISTLREGARLNPDSTVLTMNLAWFLATAPETRLRNGVESLRLAEQVNRQGESARSLDILAAACAECGQFDRAIRTAQQALHLAPASGGKPSRTEIESRLALYRTGQPYRETPASIHPR